MMKWVVVASDMKDKNLASVEDLLDSVGAQYTEVFLKQDSSQNIFSRDVQELLSASYCIIMDSQSMLSQPDFYFYMGLFLGKNAGTFVYSGNMTENRYLDVNVEGQSFFKCFKDIGMLLKYITKNFELFAIEDRQHEAMKKLLTKGIPFTSDCFAQYIAKDKSDICNLFLDAGMISNACTENGIPMLCVAARNDCEEMVKWLVENHADVNSVSEDRGYTPIMDAVWRKNYNITSYLINHGADLSVISSDGQPILVLAVGSGETALVKLLLENGADPDVKDSMGMSARSYAGLFKKPAIIELMNKFPQKN